MLRIETCMITHAYDQSAIGEIVAMLYDADW